MNSIAEVCETARNLSTDWLVICFLLLRSFFSLLAIVMMIGLMWIEKFTKRFHPNAMILLRGYLFFTIVAAASTLLPDGTDTFRFLIYRTNDPTCPFHLYSGKTAELMLIPTIFSVNALGIMFIFIGVERTIATVCASKYERMRSTVPGWVLLFVATLTSALKVLWFYSQSSVGRFNPMSSLGDVPMAVQQTALGMQLTIEILNVIIFTALYFCNKRCRNSSRRMVTSLAHKYQLNENMNSISIILQLAWFHCVFTILATVVVQISIVYFTEEQYLRYGLPTDLYPVYHCAFPFLLAFKVIQEKRKQRRLKVVNAKERKEYRNQDGHFKMLDNLFVKPEK